MNAAAIAGESPATAATLDSLGQPPGRKVGFVGRLVHQKGAEYFIESARLVSDRLPDVDFVIIGDGPLAGTLKELVRWQGMEQGCISSATGEISYR